MKLIKLIFLCQILANDLHEFCLRAKIFVPLRNKIKNLIPDLLRFSEKHFDKADENAPEQARLIYDTADNFLNVISKVEINDYNAIVYLIEAYKKDPKSLNGIANKINAK